MITLALDKKRHVGFGALTFLVAAYATVLVLDFATSLPLALVGMIAVAVGALVTTAVAWGKEWYDSLHADFHTAEQLDAVATMGGGLGGCILFTVTLVAAVFA